MQVRDIMTRVVVSAAPATSVPEVPRCWFASASAPFPYWMAALLWVS